MGKLRALWSMTRFIGELFRLFGHGIMFPQKLFSHPELRPRQDHAHWSARQPHVRLDKFSIHRMSFVLTPTRPPAQDGCEQIRSPLTFTMMTNLAAARQQYAPLTIQ